MTVLIIDDELALQHTTSLILSEEGYEVHTASNGEEGLTSANELGPEIILCDVRMPKLSGIEFLERYRANGGRAMVIIMTAYGSTDLAIDAMKRGAYDYIPKPFDADQLLLTLRKAEEREALRLEASRLRAGTPDDTHYGEIVTRSGAMRQAIDVATKAAPFPSAVLITGESGTGKGLLARFIHTRSERADGPFVPVNCSALTESALGAMLFGHRRGVVAGAERARPGLLETAAGGTIFLEEIGTMPPALQIELLRALQTGEARRLGENRGRATDVRIIAASNEDLEKAIREGRFRKELYYQIAVVPIRLMPLRRRRKEIPTLTKHFIEAHNRKLGLEIEGVEREAMHFLSDYTWPGNVRELENTIERAMIMANGPRIRSDDLPVHVLSPVPPFDMPDLDDDELSVKKHSAALERRLIATALQRTKGNRTQASKLLELSPRALLYKIRDYGLE